MLYMIGTPTNRKSWAKEAFLLEIELVDGPPISVVKSPSYRYSERMANISKEEREQKKKYKDNLMTDNISLIPLQFFKIKKFICKATDGTAHLKGDDFTKEYSESLKNFDIEIPSVYKKNIHFRYKMSKDDMQFINYESVYCCPYDMSELIYNAADETTAIFAFKSKIIGLYFGMLNNNLLLNLDRLRILNLLYSVKCNSLNRKPTDLNEDDLYDFEVRQGKYFYDISDVDLSWNLYDINDTYSKKLMVYNVLVEKTPEKYLELYNILKKDVPDFKGFIIKRVAISEDYTHCPLPFIDFKNCFADKIKSYSTEISLIEDDIETFLKSPDYFFWSPSLDDLEALATTVDILSDDMELMPVYSKDKYTLKEFLKNFKERGIV